MSLLTGLTGGAGVTAGAVSAACSAASAVTAAGKVSRFPVTNQLNYNEHDDGEHYGANYQAAPVILKKFQHRNASPEKKRAAVNDRPHKSAYKLNCIRP